MRWRYCRGLKDEQRCGGVMRSSVTVGDSVEKCKLLILRRGLGRRLSSAALGSNPARPGIASGAIVAIDPPRAWKRRCCPRTASSLARQRCLASPTRGVDTTGAATDWPAFCALRIGPPRSPGSARPSTSSSIVPRQLGDAINRQQFTASMGGGVAVLPGAGTRARCRAYHKGDHGRNSKAQGA